jgi:hypothetical protein
MIRMTTVLRLNPRRYRSFETPRTCSILISDDLCPFPDARKVEHKRAIKPCPPQSKHPAQVRHTRIHHPLNQHYVPPFFVPAPSAPTSRSLPPFLPPTSSLLNPLNTLPLPPQILLPQTHTIIAPTNRQHIPAQAPADAPHDGVEVQHGAGPLVAGRVRRRRRPDAHRLVLRRRRDVRLLQHRRRPRHVAHPVRVAGERERWGVGF